MPDAIARIRDLLPRTADKSVLLAHFVPRGGGRARTPLQRRAALASTLVAALELERDGALTLDQEGAFGEISLGRTGGDGASDGTVKLAACPVPVTDVAGWDDA